MKVDTNVKQGSRNQLSMTKRHVGLTRKTQKNFSKRQEKSVTILVRFKMRFWGVYVEGEVEVSAIILVIRYNEASHVSSLQQHLEKGGGTGKSSCLQTIPPVSVAISFHL